MGEEKFAEPGSLLLIFEEIKDQPKPLGLGIPSFKLGGDLKIDASHKKLERRIYRALFEADVYAGNNKLDRSPNVLDWLSQYIQPDKGLTTKRTGKLLGYTLGYYGYANKFSLQKNLGIPFSTDLPFINIYGSDPVPGIKLYGNTLITFSSVGGEQTLTGAAFYDLDTQKLRNIDTGSKAELFKSLVKNGDQQK